MLMFLYPFAMVLILLSVSGKWFNHDKTVYAFTVGFTTVPALLDMVSSFPPVVSQSAFGVACTNFEQSFLPFAAQGMAWVVPALVGLVLGLAVYKVRGRATANATD
jgi:LIVCS family branched-chain amino acid:cation transporter